jgi:hypothetical protein
MKEALRNRSIVGLVALALALGVLGVLLPDKVQMNSGLGVDGAYYGQLILNGFQNGTFWGGRFDTYSLQKTLPVWLIYELMRVLGGEITRSSIVAYFSWLNVVLLPLTAGGYAAACRGLNISACGYWIGGIGIVLSFAAVKWPSAYPVLTDQWALAIGAWMLACYVRGWTWGLTVLTLAGAYTWPALPIQGMLLLLFPVGSSAENTEPAVKQALQATAGVLTGILCFFAIAYVLRHWVDLLPAGISPHYIQVYSALPVTYFHYYNGFFFAVVAGYAIGRLCWIGGWGRRVHPRVVLRITAQAASCFVAWWFINRELLPTPSPLNMSFGVVNNVLWGTRFPFEQLALHSFYYGPLLILAVLKWREVCQVVQSLGYGLGGAFLFALALMLDPEPRHLIHFFPFIALLVAKVADGYVWTRWQMALFVVAALALGRLWLPMGDIGTLPFAFAWAPFTQAEFFMVQGAAVLCLSVLFAYCLCRRPATIPAAVSRHGNLGDRFRQVGACK